MSSIFFRLTEAAAAHLPFLGAVVFLIGLAGALLYRIKRYNRITTLRAEEPFEKMLNSTGFSYDSRQNIFYSRMDAWQRKYGYCRLYDELCAPLGMVVDCEPIEFEYHSQKWLMELWKGQYGLTTGCEIGVYTAEEPDISIPDLFTGTFYHCAAQEDCLPMQFVLRKRHRVLLRRSETHWWLTAFILGEYSESEELTMDLTITLKDADMRRAFVNRLLKMGYAKRELGVENNTIRMIFSRPRSPQPISHTPALCKIMQRKNKLFCGQYDIIAQGSQNMADIVIRVKNKSPELYGMVTAMGKPAKLYQAFESLRKHVEKTKFR